MESRIIDIEEIIFSLISKQKETSFPVLLMDLRREFRHTKNPKNTLVLFLQDMKIKGWVQFQARGKGLSQVIRFIEGSIFKKGSPAFQNEDGSIPIHFGPLLPISVRNEIIGNVVLEIKHRKLA